MDERSNAYAELGGGLGGGIRLAPRPAPARIQSVRTHRHSFDPVSGWCGCGRRDDGRAAGRPESAR
jgi:hypothetical protein